MRERLAEVWKGLKREKGAMIGLGLIVCVVLMALAAPLAPYSPTKRDVATGTAGPSADHWLGTDKNSFDVFSRMLYGARTSLLTGVAAIGLALLIGVPLGAISGYWRSWPDAVLMRLVDVMLAFRMPFRTRVRSAARAPHAECPRFTRNFYNYSRYHTVKSNKISASGPSCACGDAPRCGHRTLVEGSIAKIGPPKPDLVNSFVT